MDSTHPWSFSKSLSGLESRHSFNNKNMKTEEHQRPWWNWMEPSSEVLELLEEISLDGLEMYKLLTVTTLKLESLELDPKNPQKLGRLHLNLSGFVTRKIRVTCRSACKARVAVSWKLGLGPKTVRGVQGVQWNPRKFFVNLWFLLHSFNFYLSGILNPQVLNLILVEHGEHVHRLGCQAGCRAAATAKETNSS